MTLTLLPAGCGIVDRGLTVIMVSVSIMGPTMMWHHDPLASEDDDDYVHPLHVGPEVVADVIGDPYTVDQYWSTYPGHVRYAVIGTCHVRRDHATAWWRAINK